jgi:uncharacterized protein (TIRG00374 family)
MNSRISARSLVLSGLAIVIVLVLLATFIDWEIVLDQLHNANRSYLSLGGILLVLGYIVYAIRWHFLLLEKPKFIWTFHAANVASMVNMLLPLRPGDAVRIMMLGKRDVDSLINCTTSIVVERWYEQILRAAALGGAIIFGVGIKVSTLTTMGAGAYLIGMLGVMVWMVKKQAWIKAHIPRWIALLPRMNEESLRGWITTLLNGLTDLSKFHIQGQALTWSVISWALFWGYHYLFLLSINPSIGLQEALGLSLGSLALVPPSATTLPGIYQASMIVPLALVGYDQNLLASYAIILNMAELIIVMALGIWGVMSSGLSLNQLVDTNYTQNIEN